MKYIYLEYDDYDDYDKLYGLAREDDYEDDAFDD
jgi:hypothetical protein